MIEQCKLATHSPLTLAALLLLVAARPAQAQTETTLYDFGGGSDGANPRAGLTSDGKGNFYGTTEFGTAYGTSGDGTVFELSPNSTAGWNHTVLYSFCSVNSPYYCEDGANPFDYVIFDKVGTFTERHTLAASMDTASCLSLVLGKRDGRKLFCTALMVCRTTVLIP